MESISFQRAPSEVLHSRQSHPLIKRWFSDRDPIKYYLTLFWGVPPLQFAVANICANTPRVIADSKCGAFFELFSVRILSRIPLRNLLEINRMNSQSIGFFYFKNSSRFNFPIFEIPLFICSWWHRGGIGDRGPENFSGPDIGIGG